MLTRTGIIFIVHIYFLSDVLLIKIGGAYIPPARLRMMQEQIEDKSRWALFRIHKACMYNIHVCLSYYSVPYQRMAWEALKKTINGLINKVQESHKCIMLATAYRTSYVYNVHNYYLEYYYHY